MIRSSLGETGLRVRAGFWEELERDIPVRRFFAVNFNPIRFAAAAAIFLLLVGTYAAFLFLSPRQEIEEAFQQVAWVPVDREIASGDGITEEFLPATLPVSTHSTYVQTLFSEVEEETDSLAFNFSFSFAVTREEVEEYSSGNNYWWMFSSGEQQEGFRNYQETAETREEPGTGRRMAQKGWSVKVAINAFSLTSSSYLEGVRMFTKNGSSLNVVKEWDGIYATPEQFGSVLAYEKYRNTVDMNAGKERKTRVKHKFPVSVGLLAHKQLNKRIGLETGIVYSYLRSELSYGESTFFTQEQGFHYLEIPLKAEVTLYNKDRHKLYLSGGGTVGKCVAGKIGTSYYEGSLPVLKVEVDASPGGIACSVVAAAGMEYKLGERLALYAEPGVAYSFDDNRLFSTLRKDKPLNFNLLCGVRIQY